MADDNKIDPKELAAANAELDRLKKTQEEYIKSLKEANDAAELAAKLAAKRHQEEKQIRKALEDQTALRIQDKTAIDKNVQLIEQFAQIEKEKFEKFRENHAEEMAAIEEKLRTLEDERAIYDELVEAGEEISDADKKSNEAVKEQLAELEKLKAEQQKRLVIELEITQAIHEQEKATKAVDGATASLANMLTGVTANDFNNSIFKSVGGFTSMGAALSQVGSSLSTIFAPVNMATSLLSKIGQSTMFMVAATDQAQASFYKTTGAADDYNSTINTVRTEAASFGVNIEEAGAAVTELFQSMSQFSQLTKEAQVEVAAFSATMAELGVDNSVTAQTFDVLTRGLGKSTSEAIKMSSEITKSAQAIGMSVGQMHQAFNEALPTLAVYGDKSISVFQGLAAAAKETGIETSRLLDIASQFDTFESAAESVGRLNGMLGGNYLNSLEMVNMTEDERIRKMIEATQASGRAFNELGRFEQKAIANAVGITDMAEANKIFGMSLEAYDDMTAKANAGAMSQEEMAEQADKARTAQEKLQNMFQSLAIAVQPIISVFSGFLDILLTVQKIMGPFFAPTLALVAGGFLLVKVRMMQANAALAMHIKSQQIKAAMDKMQDGQAKSLLGTELARINAKMGLTTQTGLETGAESLNTSSKLANAGAQNTQNTTLLGGIKLKMLSALETVKDTAAKALNTLGIGANTAAERTGTLAKIGAIAAGAAKLAGTIALTVAEVGLTAAVYAGAAAWVFLKVIWGGFVAIATAVASALGLTASGATGTAAAAVPAAAGITALATAATAGAIGLLVLGAVALMLGGAFTLIGLGIKLAADGIVRIAEGGLTAVAVLGGLALLLLGLAKGAALLAGASAGAFAGMMLLAAGFMALALALYFISTEDLKAVGKIFDGFKDLGTASENIGTLSTKLTSLIKTFETMGDKADSFGKTMLSISSSVWSLSFALMFVDMEKLAKVGQFFTALSKVTATNNALSQTASGIREIADAIDKMPAFGTMTFSYLLEDLKDFAEVGTSITAPMNATTQFVQTVQKVEEKHVENATKLIDQVIRYADTVEGGTFAAAADNFLQDLIKILGGGKDDKKEEKGQDIYLVMDDAGRKVIASATEVYLNKKHNVLVNNS